MTAAGGRRRLPLPLRWAALFGLLLAAHYPLQWLQSSMRSNFLPASVLETPAAPLVGLEEWTAAATAAAAAYRTPHSRCIILPGGEQIMSAQVSAELLLGLQGHVLPVTMLSCSQLVSLLSIKCTPPPLCTARACVAHSLTDTCAIPFTTSRPDTKPQFTLSCRICRRSGDATRWCQRRQPSLLV